MADFLPPSTEKIWAVILNAENTSHIWPDESQIDADAGDMKLELSQATLGVGAKKGERNVLEMRILTEDGSEKTESFPIVSLREGVLEHTLINLTLNPPVSFKLVSGSGPVSLVGVQHVMGDEGDSDSDVEDYDADESFMTTESQMKTGKKRKLENSPMETKKIKSDPIKPKTNSPKEIITANNGEKEKLVKVLAGDDDSDSDAGFDSDDFNESTSEDDLGKDGGDSQDDNDDSAEPEVTPPKKQKKQVEKPKISSEKKKSPDKKGSKIAANALEAVKNKLRSNKTLPKNEDKFKNFIKTHRVSDPEQIAELWKFVEKIRKN